jgi:hypothetical protein
MRSPNAGSDKDAYIDFVPNVYSTVISPTARIEFDMPHLPGNTSTNGVPIYANPETVAETLGSSISFYTKTTNDTAIIERVVITEEGHLLPGTNNVYSLGSSDYRWTAVYAANGTIQTSDGRLKQDVQELDAGLAKVEQLRPVTFQWKDGKDHRTHLGLIAQEVVDVVPEVVVGDEQSGLGMSYSELIPVLIKALQEQQAHIEEQEARIKALEQELSGRDRDAAPEAALPGVP